MVGEKLKITQSLQFEIEIDACENCAPPLPCPPCTEDAIARLYKQIGGEPEDGRKAYRNVMEYLGEFEIKQEDLMKNMDVGIISGGNRYSARYVEESDLGCTPES